MPHFSKKSCVAFTWDEDGDCRAVLAKRAGDKCKIVKTWNAKTDKNTSVTEVLANAAKALDSKNAAFCVAGGIGNGWGMADVTMPNLPAEQLRNALAFELRKHTPLPQDKIRWGYRTLDTSNKRQDQKIRLVYYKTEVWEQSLSFISGLGQLDSLVPAPAVLDSLFSNQTVVFPARNTQDACAYTITESAVETGAAPQDASAYTFDKLIPGDVIKWNELSSLPVNEQQAYIHAAVLAAYGLTSDSSADADTLLSVPSELKPHRNILLALSAGLFLAVTVIALAFYGVVNLQGHLAQIRTLEMELKKTNSELEGLQKIMKPEKKKITADLKKELQDALPNQPPLPLVLKDLSSLIPAPVWLSGNFTWDEGLVKFTLEESVTDPTITSTIDSQELLDTLEDSPYLGDVRGLKSSFDVRNNKRTRDFDMAARYDTASEKERAQKRNQERRERARLKALEERKAEMERRRQEKANEDSAVNNNQGEVTTEIVEDDEANQDNKPQMRPPAPPAFPNQPNLPR